MRHYYEVIDSSLKCCGKILPFEKIRKEYCLHYLKKENMTTVKEVIMFEIWHQYSTEYAYSK